MINEISQQNATTDLSQYGLLAVEGADAENFLQNQFSNDVSKVSDTAHQLNSYCTPKGRMLTIFRLFKIGQTYYLRMPTSLIPNIQKRLQMYILMSKVTLRDATSNWHKVGISGDGASALLENKLGTAPSEVNSSLTSNDTHILRLPGNQRFEIYWPSDQKSTLEPELAETFTKQGTDWWPSLDILEGIPSVYPETSEHFVPQMTNLQLVDGVSFKKGCYPGQEIVARMQYRGTLKRRMHLVSLNNSENVQPGSTIVTASENKTHDAGEIVDIRPINTQKSIALAVLQISSLEESLFIENADGPTLQLEELPYPFPTAED